MSILVVGSVALDTVSTPYGKLSDALGGSATYFSAAASFFSPVKIVAVVGEDFDASAIDFLKERGVDTEGIAVEKGETFRWVGSYGESPTWTRSPGMTRMRKRRIRPESCAVTVWPVSSVI